MTFEQFLCGGAAGLNLIFAAHYGFGIEWVASIHAGSALTLSLYTLK